MLEASIFYTI